MKNEFDAHRAMRPSLALRYELAPAKPLSWWQRFKRWLANP